jgi:hypothetical protein
LKNKDSLLKKENTMNKLIGFLAFIFINVTLLSTSFAGMQSDSYSIKNSVFSTGGIHATSTNFEIESSLGQSSPLLDPSDPPWSTNYEIYPGFWYVVYAFEYNCPGDFNGDKDVDGSDLSEYILNPGELDLEIFATHFGEANCRQK